MEWCVLHHYCSKEKNSRGGISFTACYDDILAMAFPVTAQAKLKIIYYIFNVLVFTLAWFFFSFSKSTPIQ